MPIEDILKDFSILQKKDLPENIKWIRNISQNEASESLIRWKKICEEDESKKFDNSDVNRCLENSLQSPVDIACEGIHCLEPEEINSTVKQYADRLEIGEIFYSKLFNYNYNTTDYIISDFYYNDNDETLSVATTIEESGLKNYYLTTVSKDGNEFKYDTTSFFEEDGLNKYMTIAKGLEWTGGDVFDDYC